MIKKISKFLVEVKQELKKVSWSTRKELIEATTVVLVSTAILTGIIWTIDFVYSQIIKVVFR